MLRVPRKPTVLRATEKPTQSVIKTTNSADYPVSTSSAKDEPKQGDAYAQENSASSQMNHATSQVHVASATWSVAVPWDGVTFGTAWAQIWALTWYLAYGGMANWAAYRGMPLEDLPSSEVAMVELTSQVLQLVGVVMLLRSRLGKHQPLPPGLFSYRLSPESLAQAAAGAGVAVALVWALGLVADGTGPADNTQAFTDLMDVGGAQAQAAVVASTLVVGPIAEEYVYRGFILVSLTKWLPVPAALLFSSLAFAAFHLDGTELLPLTLLGGVLGGCMVLGRGNLLVPTLAHSAYNLSALLVAHFADGQ